MAYILKGRALPDHVDDTTSTPCIFCGTSIRHVNEGGTGCYLSAVVGGQLRGFAYCNDPPCPQRGADEKYERSIWRCACVDDYVENVGETCAACGRARKDAVGPRSPTKRYHVVLSGHALMRGGLLVEARSKDAAGDVALAQTGNVCWDYEGMDDDTIEIVSVEEKKE